VEYSLNANVMRYFSLEIETKIGLPTTNDSKIDLRLISILDE